MRPGLDAFGRPIGAVADLDLADRVDAARHLAGRLQARYDALDQWLGAGLGRWLSEGGNLGDVLGLHGAPGLVRAEQIAALRRRLVMAAGSVAAAARAMRHDRPALALHDLVAELHALGAASSLRSFYLRNRAAHGPHDGTL